MPHTPPNHRAGAPRRDRRVDQFIDRARISEILRPFVPDEDDRAFVVRCLLEEGPTHHRGSNWVLVALLSELVGDVEPGPVLARAVPMRLPPHLAEGGEDEAMFPLGIPQTALERLAPGDPRAQEAMLDCLTDGPPQHALANAALVCLIDAALRRSAG